MTFHFTTVVSKDYIYKFLAMEGSLRKNCKSYRLFALCSDSMSYKILKTQVLKNTTLIPVSSLEKGALLSAKENRSNLEYCWTLKPYFMDYVMSRWKDTSYYAHLDSDLYFLSDINQVIEEAPEASIIITDHNNSENFMHTYRTSGRYNTGFVCLKNNNTGCKAAEWWKKKCLECCTSTADTEKRIFGDQRYVEAWPEMFEDVHVAVSKGINVAQWNIQNYKVSENHGKIYVNNDKLVFYHFSGLHIIGDSEYSLTCFYRLEEDALSLIYLPYIKKLQKLIQKVKSKTPGFTEGFTNPAFVPQIHHIKLAEITAM